MPWLVFLSNQADMNDVYPMEEFDCSLGVDPAVKVTYKPRKLFNASSGLLGKVESDTHEQVIVVKNTHDYSITVTVIDQLPRSRSERVKVRLLGMRDITKQKVTMVKMMIMISGKAVAVAVRNE